MAIGGAPVALPGSAPGSVDPATDRVLTFGGARAHERGIPVVGGTLTPFAGTGPGAFTPAREAARDPVMPGSATGAPSTPPSTSTRPCAIPPMPRSSVRPTIRATPCTRTTPVIAPSRDAVPLDLFR